jgi:hypothetical protein
MTVRMFGNNAPKPPSNRAAALRSEMSAGYYPACDEQPEGVHQDVTLAAFDAIVRVEAANAATVRRLHRLAIHDHDRRTGFPTGLRRLRIWSLSFGSPWRRREFGDSVNWKSPNLGEGEPR